MTGRLLHRITAAAVLAVTALVPGCQTPPAASAALPLPPPPDATVPRLAQAPSIDGDLGDWPTAVTVDGLYPFLGGRYQDRIDAIPTQIRIGWTPEALYLAFDCVDPDVYMLRREGDAEASLHMGDLVEVFLDPVGDSSTWIELQVNPLNQTFDKHFRMTGPAQLTDTGRITTAAIEAHMERHHTGFHLHALQTAARPTERGWTVEIAIPAPNLGRDRLGPGILRANLVRYKWDPKAGDESRQLVGMVWSPVQSGCPHISPQRYGRLHLVDAAAE